MGDAAGGTLFGLVAAKGADLRDGENFRVRGRERVTIEGHGVLTVPNRVILGRLAHLLTVTGSVNVVFPFYVSSCFF